MNHHYSDIRDRIPEEPKWFDENAVPRYCEFEPNKVAGIYAAEVVLAVIACQTCQRRFNVAFSMSRFNFYGGESLADRVGRRQLHYGDPPNVQCCASGPTMTSDMLRVLQFWNKKDNLEWRRVAELEIAFDEKE